MSWLVEDKQPVPDLNDTRVAPRTAIGLDGSGARLILIVVDGRQPFYSDGCTVQELAELMLLYGGDNAINLDGGGSSTMVIDWPGEGVKVVNSPIDLYFPGRERPVANHFGVFATKK
jgi:exopolysaccharide biosynthesis protein